jgi:hypothetical protein
MSEAIVDHIVVFAIVVIFLSTWLGVMLGLREAGARNARLVIIPKSFALAGVYSAILYGYVAWLQMVTMSPQ